MNHFTPQWHLDTEIIVDNFAGGGGASTGIEMALGRPVNIAINHDHEAVMMHQANHPHTQHFCEDVFAIDPAKVCNGRRVALAWFSPDCTHHSKAKGGKPRSKKIRGLAWVVIRWAAKVRPRVIMLENVEEFADWGPLDANGKPCKTRKGKTFLHWKTQLERLGYKVEFRVLRACDYGVPTIRKRLFVIARCDGKDIVWPVPTHGDPKSEAVKKKRLKPWPVAADIIDWDLPCPSIFMDPAEAKKRGLKRPLAEKTMQRIARGLQKFVFNNPNPFIVTVNHGGDHFRGQSLDDPFLTVTAARDGHGLVHPFIQHVQHSSANGIMPPDEPLRTVTATPKGGGMALATVMVQHNNTSADSRSPASPVSTVTTSGSQQGLAVAHITKFRNGSTGYGADEPVHTVTSGGAMARPGTANPQGVIVAHLDRQFGSSIGQAASDPTHTITAGGTGKTAICASSLVKLRGTCQHGQAVTAPVPTVTAGGNHVAHVKAFLLKYYGTGEGQKVDDPMGTVTSRDRFGIVTIKGEEYQIADIGLRMLTPRELYRAQGFPDSYLIGDKESDGFKLPKSQQVAKCGNSVCPPLAAALVRANVAASSLFAPMEKAG
ncbi:DNA cytosine methyltransferase [Thalassospira marina]|uniref:DNA (cytosine-5-)-methyltransferase n=1 Tax=Thalassospira marina TaxID=2048283 RepID=A0A2N3KV30_9PROT|nr:DNA cytosine methyltransferase [Thalassospira marina]PKR54441.1 type II restriction endonuclease subunit M [Thalassospira marina]